MCAIQGMGDPLADFIRKGHGRRMGDDSKIVPREIKHQDFSLETAFVGGRSVIAAELFFSLLHARYSTACKTPPIRKHAFYWAQPRTMFTCGRRGP